MPNAVLDRLLVSRQEQITFIDQSLERVESEGRDLVDAEVKNLDAARARIVELNAQIAPLEEFETLRSAHDAAVGALPRPQKVPAQARQVGGDSRAPEYRSAGEYLVDLLRARGILDRAAGPDQQAAARIQARALANQTTADTPGILPTPIVGTVVNLIDANRPLISSLGGAKALGGIPGSTFTRPKIGQHVAVGPQTAEKTQLPSQKMTISAVPFTKQTYGGTVDISRQDIDWTSPGAWDILVKDLADVYAIQTETAVAGAFHTAAGHTPVVVAANTLQGWTTALYTAAASSYAASFRMPDRIWCALDVWAALGSLVDVGRVVFPPDAAVGGDAMDSYDVGGSNLSNFRGDVLGLPRIVVPTLPAGTCILGPSGLYEAYEEVIGLLSVIEPSILGVTVAYGGYVAFGSLAPAAFVPITPPAGLPVVSPTQLSVEGESAPKTAPAKK